MRRTLLACALGSLLLCGPAAAVPGVDEPSTIHVNALRHPELRKYKAILAGLDSFERHHALAPNIPALRFRIEARHDSGLPEQPTVRIEREHDFILPLALDTSNRFTVPRSEAALDAGGELVLNQKRKDYRIVPEVRTPGLPDNMRRLGDLRLECKVTVAIAKEEIPLFWVLTLNSVLLNRDWCNFFSEKERRAGFRFNTETSILAATLREGGRSMVLETGKKHFLVGLSDAEWSDEALVELEFGTAPPASPAAPTGTAGETPRTAP
ncbi:hypothetical protein [Massilia litorea]|uniref:DUF2987 domain-containing protein n=1 Tax=Massilia litorea TaxID=2769491 RepID=A0A7L9U2N5_9BURK|nr:hypothetical protein [Massilia litorea]QOL49238.1 hypothetical protein LPB04_20360 [Massilia litorea]